MFKAFVGFLNRAGQTEREGTFDILDWMLICLSSLWGIPSYS
jgi:hypothetical protein